MAHRVPARLTAAEGRRFAWTVGGAFLTFGALAWWRGRATIALVLAAIGAVLVLLGAIVPARLGALNRAWMGLATALSKVTAPIFMGVIFFGIITPMGVAPAVRQGSAWADRAWRDALAHARGGGAEEQAGEAVLARAGTV